MSSPFASVSRLSGASFSSLIPSMGSSSRVGLDWSSSWMTERRSSAATWRIFSDWRSCGARTSDWDWRWRRSWLKPPELIGFEACCASWIRRAGEGGKREGGLGCVDAEKLPHVGPQLLVGGAVAAAVEVDLEVVQDLGRGLVALVTVAPQQPLDDGLKPLVEVRSQRAERGNRHVEDVAPRLGPVDAAEDVLPEEDLRQHDPEREEVGAGVGDRVARLLGREVLVLAGDHLALLVVHEVEGLRYPEVRQLHVALVAHEHVLWADVAVDDVQVVALAVQLLVGVGKAPGDPGDDECGQVDGHLPPKLAVPVEELLDVVAPDILHHHEVLAVHLPQVVGLDDVGVDQVRDEAGLPDEVLLEFRYRRVLAADELHGDRLLELAGPVLVRLVHDAHPALRYRADHLVGDPADDLFVRCHRVEIEAAGQGACK